MNTNIKPVIQKHVKGLNTDLNPVDQPQGTYRFALNTINITREGDMMSVANEESMEPYHVFEIHDKDGSTHRIIVIGTIYVDDNEHVLFGTTDNEDYSVIALLNDNGEVTSLVEDAGNRCFNFRLNKQISGTYRLRNGCEKTIYWTDNRNPIRTLNLSKIDNLFSVGGKLSCEKLNLIKSYDKIPNIEFKKVFAGGNILSGNYNIAIQLVDENDNTTNWITVSQTVPVIVQSLTGDYDSVHGSSNKSSHENTELRDLLGENYAAKSLEYKITNIDDNYAYYRVAVLVSSAGTKNVTKAYASPKIPRTIDTFIFDGNINDYMEIAPEEVLLGKVNIETAVSITQVENRLLLGNVKSTFHNVCELQKYASKIKTEYVTKKVKAKDYKANGNPKDPHTMWDSMSFMGDEVYALGIVYINKDMTESPVMHIPGRPARGAELMKHKTFSEDIRPFVKHEYKPGTALREEDEVPSWKVYDTSDGWDDNNPEKAGLMSYYESEISEYDQNIHTKCNGGNYWGKDWAGNNLQGPIRHHKFPSRSTVPVVTKSNYSENYRLYYVFKRLGALPIEAHNDEWAVTIRYDKSDDGVVWNPVTMIVVVSGIQLKRPTEQSIYVEGSKNNYELKNFSIQEVTPLPGNSATFDYVNEVQDDVIMKKDIGHSTKDPYIVLIGTNFSNIELPDGIIGYYFVRAERTDMDKTVLGKGYSGHTRTNDDYIVFNSFSDNYLDSTGANNFKYSDRDKYVMSPENAFRHKQLTPDYLKVEGIYNKKDLDLDSPNQMALFNVKGVIQNIDDEKTGWADNDGHDWRGGCSLSQFEYAPLVKNINRKVEKNNYLTPYNKLKNYTDSDNGEKKTLYNTTQDNDIQIVGLYEPYEDGDKLNPGDTRSIAFNKIYYVAEKNNISPYSYLENIKYYKMHTNPFYDTDRKSVYGGDTFINNFDLSSSSYQGVKNPTNVIEFVVSAIIIIASAVVTIVSLGTLSGITVPVMVIAIALLVAGALAKISIEAVKTFYQEYNDSSLKDVSEDVLKIFLMDNIKDDTYFNTLNSVSDLWIESEINIGYRETIKGPIPSFLDDMSLTGISSYTSDKFLYEEGERKRWYVMPPIEVYKENIDFSRMNKEKIFFALADNYDCCSKCIEEFPNRIHYSEKSFIEEHSDSYSQYLPLNYIDIPGEYGEITNIFTRSNALYAHTAKTIWYIAQNVQERVTGDVVSLVGTGGFFSMPARKIQEDMIGSGGSTQRFATLSTKYGTFFVDDSEKKLYLLNFSSQAGTQMDSISDKGMAKWFDNNIPLQLVKDYYSLTGQQFPNYINPVNNAGVGYMAAMDYSNMRLIVSKKDCTIAEKYRTPDKFKVVNNPRYHDGALIGICRYTTGPILIFNKYDNKFYFLDCIGRQEKVSRTTLNNTEFFENKSWTLSYSFISGGWTSFHSYLPRLLFFDHNNLYSISSWSGREMYTIWKHNIKGEYLKFYGVRRPQILEYVVSDNPVMTTMYDTVMIQTEAIKNDTEQRYVTWNKAILFNSRQCSGELNLDVLEDNLSMDYMVQSITNVTSSSHIKKTNKNWRLNNFRDMRINYDKPIWLKDWDNIKTSYFIDKVLNDITLGNKVWEERESFKDKYLIIRLIFDNKNDVKLLTNYTITDEQSINQ